ncbi:hypothetical protein CAI21_16835 [Alkalilimnicola ehrlichii]|uniref:Uncharacterized protein n=1 Tax=Alkalilimnicola ehrlichii TaxID=351052 RepID=A0A3E0WMJ0_9GAMM|nr:hypothetical protein [Alkalilimnicola ehrlichii]RFA26358.1 hypothetical protein CAI21_16835 [Alkalilimnicola ehrlichii]RFA33423.1 hypothetical protein CAL65_17320 [Alkalilimnicola ehrlichii]
MKLRRIWSAFDHILIACCLFLGGLLLGMFFHATVREYFWFLLVVLIVLLIKPIYSYWSHYERRQGAKEALTIRDREDDI